MESMKNTNKDYQARFRKKQADEKNRLNELIKNYDRPDIDSKKKLLESIKKAMKNIHVGEDGKFRALDKYSSPNTFIVEGLEYLAIMLRKTNAEDIEAHFEMLRQDEIESHNKKMAKIKLNYSNFDYLPTSSKNL